jgi:hypothetical protein
VLVLHHQSLVLLLLTLVVAEVLVQEDRVLVVLGVEARLVIQPLRELLILAAAEVLEDQVLVQAVQALLFSQSQQQDIQARLQAHQQSQQMAQTQF